MKLLQFLFKYFLFRSTRRVKNIERVIRAHGFSIYYYRPYDNANEVNRLIGFMGLQEYSEHRSAFIGVDNVIKGVFVRKNLHERDRNILLFHEMAHIWYNHLNLTGFVENTDVKQEMQANLFMERLRALKAATFILLGVGVAAVLKQILGG